MSYAPRAARAAALPIAAAFLTGAAGLALQFVWMRRLALVVGASGVAMAIVVAAFMAGMALGSAVFGRHVRERTAAWLAAGIAVSALILPLTLGGGWAAGLAFLVPTTLMGGMLPALARRSSRVSLLYAASTFGGAFGIAGAAVALVPALGLRGTELVAAALCGLAALATAARGAAEQDVPAEVCGAAPVVGGSARSPAEPPSRAALPPFAPFLAGMAALIGEVIWTRVVELVVGSSVYAPAATITMVLVGSGLGALIFARSRGGPEAARRWFAVAALLAAAAVVAVILAAPALVAVTAALHDSQVPRSWLWILDLGVVTGLVVLPAAVAFGAAFAAALSAAGSAGPRAEAVGRTSAINAVGTLVGTLGGALVLMPALGIQGALAVLVGVVGAAAVLAAPRRRGVAVAAGALLALAFLAPVWSTATMTSAPGFFLARAGGGADWRAALAATRVLFYADGRDHTVSVDQIGPHRFYRSNGKTDASTYPRDVANQALIGHLPALLHGHPQRAFVLGLGTGITAAAVLRHGLAALDVVDIEGRARDAATYFAAENGDLFADPRVHFHAADGRAMLREGAGEAPYDLVLVDGSDLWTAGAGQLFSTEFYSLARARLAPDGVFAEWFHVHGLTIQDVATLAATFRGVFPQASLWRLTKDDFLLIGAGADRVFDGARVLALAGEAGAAGDLAAFGVSRPVALFATFLADGEDFAGLARLSPRPLTDDRPGLEFAAPKTLYLGLTRLLEQQLESRQRHVLPPTVHGLPDEAALTAADRLALARGLLARERLSKADELLRRLVAEAPGDRLAADGLADVYAAKGEADRAAGLASRAAPGPR